MDRLLDALVNLGVALVAGLFVYWLLAQQRAARLRYQLGELHKIVRGIYESEPMRRLKHVSHRKPAWENVLGQIREDVESGADRFVRLNGKTKEKLASLFYDLPDGSPMDRMIEATLTGDTKLLKPPQRDELVERIEKLQRSISWRCFIEWGG